MLERLLRVFYILPSMEEEYGELSPHYLVEGKWVESSKTKFIDISEDPFGFDVYEFEYQGKIYSSHSMMR